MQLTKELDVEEALRQGFKNFMNLTFLVEAGVYVPRQATELLARTAIEIMNNQALSKNHREEDPLRIIDVGCGVGNLACSIARNVLFSKVWATDIDESAVNLAKKNVVHLNLSHSVCVCQGDLFSALPLGDLERLVDVIVGNPPYISSVRLDNGHSMLLENEPRAAFDGGPYGIEISQPICKDAPRWLRSGGCLLLEIGVGQEKQLEMMLKRTELYKEILFVHDEFGEESVVVART